MSLELTKDQLIEKNKAIAEFLGYRYFAYNDIHSGGTAGWRKPNKGHFKIDGWYICRSHNDLPFKHDWNWLMKAVRKIHANQEHFVYNRAALSTALQEADIHRVWGQVCEYVQWFNEKSTPL